ncbi:Transposase [Nostoc sp. DSM 114161]
MIAFLNLKFWSKSEQVWVIAVPIPKTNRRQLNLLETPKPNKPGYSYNKVAQISHRNFEFSQNFVTG